MTENEFELAVTGDADGTEGGLRLCYLVAEGLSARAKERKLEGRNDIAKKLESVAEILMIKARPTMNALRRISSDVGIVKQRLVDVPIDEPYEVTLLPTTRPIATTQNLAAFLTADGRILQIMRNGAVMVQIKMSDVSEYAHLLAKIKGLSELRKMVPLYGELEPPKR
jgi:hypothetical protein